MTNWTKSILIERIDTGYITTVADNDGRFDVKNHFTDIDKLIDYIKQRHFLSNRIKLKKR